jgi:hypothetical protein
MLGRSRPAPASGPGMEDGGTTLGSSGRTAPPPTTYRSSTLNWRQGDTIPLTADRTLRVLDVRDDDADQPPVLVVEDLPRAGHWCPAAARA